MIGRDKHYYVYCSTSWNDAVTPPTPCPVKLTPNPGEIPLPRLSLSLPIRCLVEKVIGNVIKQAPFKGSLDSKVGILRGAAMRLVS